MGADHRRADPSADPVLHGRAEDQRPAQPPRRYLLSGLLRCHKCDHSLYSAAREDVRRYVCSSGPDHGGCGGTFAVAGPVEDLIAQAVLFRLDTPELADALAGRAAADERTAELAQALAEDQVQLAELTTLYASRSITAREWMEARNPIQARIEKEGRASDRPGDPQRRPRRSGGCDHPAGALLPR